jgi:murein DD-endopeptidase MepM/ murein hydrolase activator NlpD
VPPIAMPEADERPRAARIPLGRVPRVPAPRAAADAAPIAERPAPAATPAPTRPARGLKRFPHPPGRRAPLWLAALISGALLAAFPVFGGSEPTRVDASDYGLGIGGIDPSGELADAGARRGITEAEASARLGELAASRAAREPKVVSPVTSYRLTTCYCLRWGQMHYGLDMAAPLGTPIYAAIDGVVLEAGPASGFGNAIYIQDEDGNVHIYGHMRYYTVHAGQIVHAGDKIASVGNEGFSTGPHLHYEIHRGGRDGSPSDPEVWLENRGVPVG